MKEINHRKQGCVTKWKPGVRHCMYIICLFPEFLFVFHLLYTVRREPSPFISASLTKKKEPLKYFSYQGCTQNIDAKETTVCLFLYNSPNNSSLIHTVIRLGEIEII